MGAVHELLISCAPQDKAERARRLEETHAVQEAHSSTAAAARADFVDSSHSTLNIRTEEGALRHKFDATATLAQVSSSVDTYLARETRRMRRDAPQRTYPPHT